jgi:ABC-type Fe3+-hydroxamate transport system substrate-binding protein
VSLVPSQTEFLFSLGLEERVVGITKFCIHPEQWFRSKIRVGGTKNLDLDAIKQLQPDLIIANKEENTKDQIELLRKDIPVWTSDIETFEDALEMMHQLGAILRAEAKTEEIVQSIKKALNEYELPATPIRVAYLIWNNPVFTIAGNTFISDWLAKLGMENVFAHRSDDRYPNVTLEEIAAAMPELLLLSSEPFPFKHLHLKEFAAELPGIVPVLVDGEMCSWYGSRMALAPPALQYLVKR